MIDTLKQIDELDSEITAEVEKVLSENYPWLPTRMDFSQIKDHEYLHWGNATDDEVEQFILCSSLSSFSYVAALYSPKIPIKIFGLEYAAKELDPICLDYTCLFLLGAEKLTGNWRVDTKCFAQLKVPFDIWVTKSA